MADPRQVDWVPEFQDDLLAYLERQVVDPNLSTVDVLRLCADPGQWQRVDYDIFAMRAASLPAPFGGTELLVAIEFEDVHTSLFVILGVVQGSLPELQIHLSSIEYKRRINTAIGRMVRGLRFAFFP
jgi:hypothetical protein